MIKKIILVIKGFLIGIGLIIPGVSGGTMAIILGIYERILDVVNSFFKKVKENLLFVTFLGIGMILAVLLGSIALKGAFEHFILPTTLFFVGLVLGGIPAIYQRIKPGIKKPTNYIWLFLTVLLIIGVSLLSADQTPNDLNTIDLSTIILLFVLGFIAAATMIIPGISGSLVLMVLGYYNAILTVVSELAKFQNIGHNLLIIIPFVAGVALGIVVFAKIIKFLIARFEVQSFFGIMGFIIASLICIIITNLSTLSLNTTEFIIQIIVGVIIMILSMIGTYFICSLEVKQEAKAELPMEAEKDLPQNN